jgi:mRNA interferase RelE/StbE
MNQEYHLKLHRSVEKVLRRIPGKHRERMVQTMRSLCEDPRPPGCVKLDDSLYRLREGQYRVVYAIFEEEIVIVVCKVARRAEDTCKNLPALLARAESLLDK